MSDLPRTETQETNAEWLAALRAAGTQRDAAVNRLRDYLLRAVLVYLTRHRTDLAGLDFQELEQLAEDWAQQALIQVLDKLDSFRGDSKFTTWAYRVAINLVAGDLRRKRWENVSLEQLAESESPEIGLTQDVVSLTPEVQLIRAQVWQTVQAVIESGLSDRQRTVLTQIVLEGVPVEIVADRLSTNRNNIYKILHDARRKLKHELEMRAWRPEDVLEAFSPGPDEYDGRPRG